MWLKQLRDFTDSVDDLSQVGDLFLVLPPDELHTRPLANLKESVARHVFDPRVRLMHELEQLLDNSLQELPVPLQEYRELSDHVHYITRHHRLVVFPSFAFAKRQQVFNHSNYEFLFGVFFQSTRNAANGSTQCREFLPAPFGLIHLGLQLVHYDVFSVFRVQDSQAPCRLFHIFIQGN